jgi:hypothetical protein
MAETPKTERRPSGYVRRLQELAYGLASSLYDLFVYWVMLPLGDAIATQSREVRAGRTR